MEIVKLNFENYVPGRSVRENVIACLPGTIETINIKGRNDLFLIDRENLRLFIITTETCPPSSKEACPALSLEKDYSDRGRLYTSKVLPEGINILDYDAYIIAAAECDGDKERDIKLDLGWYSEPELFRDSFPIGENKTFHYVSLPYFDKQKYLDEYAEEGSPDIDGCVSLNLMQKYIYQRTSIDVDNHGEALLVYQDETSFEGLLASINWFHDGQPTGFENDKEFLRIWDKQAYWPLTQQEKKAIGKIRNNVAVSGVDARIVISNRWTSKPKWNNASEYLEFGKGKCLQLLFTASFGNPFEGSLQFELNHQRSGTVSKWGMHKPEKRYCNGEPLRIHTENFSLDQIIGQGYQIPPDRKDYVTVRMFHNNREVFRKDFQIRRAGA